MGHHQGARMPASLRHQLRVGADPARSVPCPHPPCHARAHNGCVVRVKGRTRTLAQLHPARIRAWVITTACCPECQVTPGTPCHDDGRALIDDVHDRRVQEAKETLA